MYKDDIVKENTEVLERKRREHLEKLRAPRPKKVVAVHTDKLLATALPGTELAEQNAAQPSKTVDALAPLEEIAKTMTSEIDSAESESELAESEDTAPTESAGAGASTNSPNAKFYMGQNGYVNLLSERVKLHSITPNNRTQHLEIDERTL